MITKVFETHLNVADLERSMAFYEQLPGAQLEMVEETRRIAFFFLGGWNHSMLGLWEKPKEQVWRQHTAFEIPMDRMDEAIQQLHARGIETKDFYENPSNEPFVFAWMPAAAIYFDDPDGHLLEYIAIMDAPPRPELGIASMADWRKR